MALLPIALQAVFDDAGNRVMDARLQVYEAGTTTPASVYVDGDFSILAPNPLSLRGNGTWPLAYLGGGNFRLRTIWPDGRVIDDVDNVTIPGAVSIPGGSGGSVDATTIFATGDVKQRYGLGAIPGWARLNGRTIGSSGSAATERGNADCEALFLFLWNANANLAVSGGRGASAEADWSSDKTIALPDARGRTLFGLDGMGNSSAGRLAGALFGFGSANLLGSYGGEATHTLTAGQMPVHAHTATASVATAGSHIHTGATASAGDHTHVATVAAGGAHGHTGTTAGDGNHNHAVSIGSSGAHPHSGTTNGGGNHNHDVAVSSAGSHDHTGTAAAAGAHTHDVPTASVKNGTAGSGSTNTGIWAGPNTDVASGSAGSHGHTLNINNAGAHTHAASTDSSGNHTHGFAIDTSGAHTHTGATDASGTHTHDFSIASSGSHAHTATNATAGAHTHNFTTAATGAHIHAVTVDVANAGTGTAFNQLPPFLLVSAYIKL